MYVGAIRCRQYFIVELVCNLSLLTFNENIYVCISCAPNALSFNLFIKIPKEMLRPVFRCYACHYEQFKFNVGIIVDAGACLK